MFVIASAEQFAEIIRALATLAWPALIAVFILVFRDDLRSLLGRIREASAPGMNVKFDAELDHLQGSAQAAVESLPPGRPDDGNSEDLDPTVREAMELAARSPRAALILLSAELERRVRQIAAQTGRLYANPSVWRNRPVTSKTLQLFELPPTVLDAVDDFRHVRNRIVHGQDATDTEVLRAIDAALMILQALDRVPREVNVVHSSDVPLYSDQAGEYRREGVHGVILQTTHSEHPGDSQLRIFPSTRRHFRVGEPVAWEWGTGRSWGETWYTDPDTQEIKYAWTTSSEFIGTHLSEVV